MVEKLRDAETNLAAGKTIAEVVQVPEVSEQTDHRCTNKYPGMKIEEAKRNHRWALSLTARVQGLH